VFYFITEGLLQKIFHSLSFALPQLLTQSQNLSQKTRLKRELELGIYETSKFMTDSLQAETSRKDCTEG
jgi:hypothetical protein